MKTYNQDQVVLAHSECIGTFAMHLIN